MCGKAWRTLRYKRYPIVNVKPTEVRQSLLANLDPRKKTLIHCLGLYVRDLSVVELATESWGRL